MSYAGEWLVAGRREVPVDPQAGPVQEFAHALRKLRTEAGQPTYRELSREAGFSVTTLSLAASGRELPSLKVALAYVRACGGDVGEWEARWRAAGAAVRDTAAADRTEPSPYRGLARYESSDSDLFFGRDQITADVLDLIARQRFAMVFGPSGSGKTSLLRAAVIPALREPRTTASTPALAGIRILTPGPSPARTHRHLLTDTRTSQGGEPDGDVLVIVDQFEEVFTLCQDPDERDAFVRMLLEARDPASRLRVVCAARADFYRHCVEHPDLADALRDAHLPVPPMTPPELRDAIVKPAAAAGLIVERELTARLADTVNGRPGALPLLSHALLETWHRRSGRILTTTGYEEAGGLDGAVATTAENLYTHLTASQQNTLRQLLLRLVAPGHDDSPDTRRPLTRGEFDAFRTSGDSNGLIEALAQARLVTLDDQSLELTHEALLTAWPRLRGWIDEARERLRIHRALTEAAHTWHTLERDPGALYRGTRLSQAEEHLDADQLTPLEGAFLTAGTAARGQEQQAAVRASRRLRRLRTVLSLIAVLALLVGGIAWQQDRSRNREEVRDEARRIAALTENIRRSDPKTAMRLGLAAHRIADLPETRAALMSAATQKEDDVFIAPDPGAADPHVRFLLTADGRSLLRLGTREVVRWDVATHRRTGTFPGLGAHAQRVQGMSPDGHLLAVGIEDTVLWDIRTGRVGDWKAPGRMAEFGSSGRTIVVSSVSKTPPFKETVQLREVETGRVLWQLVSPGATLPTGGMTAVSADDRLVAVCEAGRQVRLWEVATRRPVDAPWAPQASGPRDVKDPVRTCHLSLRFTKGSQRLAQEGLAGVRVWDIASGRQLTNTINTADRRIAHSSDGDYLGTQGKGSIQLLRISKDEGPPAFQYAVLDDRPEQLVVDIEQRQIRYLMGRTVRSLSIEGAVTSDWSDTRIVAAPGPGNRTLASVRVATSAGRLRFKLSGEGGPVTEFSHACTPPSASPTQECPVVMAFSQDGRAAAFGSQTQAGQGTLLETLVVVDVRTGRTTAVIRRTVQAYGFQHHLVDIAFAPDGKSLFVSRSDSLPADHWDLRTRTLIRTVPGLWGALASRPGDGVVLSASGNLLEVKSGRMTSTPLVYERVDALSYSPDGKFLATVDRFGRVALWDPVKQRRLSEFPADPAEPSDAAEVLAFSPDNRTLAAGSEGSVRLWDVPSLRRLGMSLPTGGSTVSALSFSSDSRALHATYGRMPPQNYRLDPASLIARVCARVATGLSETDWKANVRTASYRSTCAKPRR
ncbi:hypothetical protein [Streptomyces albipurpureus]|uniref:HTH cro/C1-type domain-containing protein n=1 Tax=Streptomyces albipurpureus TaxID=2897419 RepID=A0ABT0UJ07_9ACTN|nr:hypothetical protein [Streptomyces sp. CWNU-1]MCM2388321.1 hypothetical protein [Streptomyces sp. CWNU-1]